jgi:hypothetical protein
MEDIFEGERVHKLTDGQVRQLMEEDSATAAKRKELRDQESVLQSGLDICRDIAGRPDLGPYERQEPSLFPGYDASTRMSRPDPFADREDTSPPVLPARALVTPNDVYPPGRKPLPTWQDGYEEDLVDEAEPSGLSGNYSSNAQTPTTAEDEDAQLQRALEESKRDAERKSRYMPAALSTRTNDDDDSIVGSSTGRPPKRRGLFARG